MKKIRIGIYGYGNLGRGVECALEHNFDMETAGIFTHRDPSSIETSSQTPVYPAQEVLKHKGDIDVMIICKGSAKDLPEITPYLSAHFNTVDSFDTHSKIPLHFEAVDTASKEGCHTSLISAGWDPGLFSLARLYSMAFLPGGNTSTFWGRGVSQGHSEAVRRIDGVLDARQYTLPSEEAMEKIRRGEVIGLDARERHTRVVYVTVEDGADKERIEREIKTMPDYFEGYKTDVYFITKEEMEREHRFYPHGGRVISTGRTGPDRENLHTFEFALSLSSNPEFTASVLVSFARAVFRMFQNNDFGAKTVFDVRPKDLSPLSVGDLRKSLL